VSARRRSRAALVVLLGLGAMTVAIEAPALEARRLAAVSTHLGPAPHDAGRFKNLDPTFRRASNWTRARFAVLGLVSLLNAPRRFEPLPAGQSHAADLQANRHEATVTWIGHSTLLVQLDGLNILTDPNWSPRTGPFSGRVGVGRYTPPGLSFDELPPIEVVLISHDHYDHLDEPTVRRLAARWNPRFVVPLGIKAWLADRGITKVEELDWGQSITINDVVITCTPAQHGSGRTVLDQGHRLWSSWAVIGSKRFYFGGDSGYAAHFKLIGDELGPFDLAALPIGSYTPPVIARPVHMSPEEALRAWRDLHATRFVGIHWGTFSLGEEPYDEPPRRLAQEVKARGLDAHAVWILKPGESVRW
jgi:N-acyl-phosphatidylethanolamine-hydrolysing phospholipase D